MALRIKLNLFYLKFELVVALLVLEEDENIIERNNIKEEYPFREKIYLQRRKRVNEIVNSVVTETKSGASFKTRLSQLMLKPLTGILYYFLTLFIMYQFLGVIIAQTVVGLTEEIIMVLTIMILSLIYLVP